MKYRDDEAPVDMKKELRDHVDQLYMSMWITNAESGTLLVGMTQINPCEYDFCTEVNYYIIVMISNRSEYII